MSNPKFVIAAVAGVTLLVLSMLVIPVAADAGGSAGIQFQIFPGAGNDSNIFVFDLTPGERIVNSVNISNSGEEEVAIRLFAASAATASAGGVVVPEATSRDSGLASWITIKEERVIIGPGDAVEVEFSVAVPANASAGKHAAALVAENEAVARGTSALSISTVQRAVVMVLGTTPGDLTERLEITDIRQRFRGGVAEIEIDLANTGTNYVYPSGVLELTTDQGKPVASVNLKFGMFLPNTDITHRVRLAEQLPEGNYLASVDLTYGADPNSDLRSQVIARKATFEVVADAIEEASRDSALLDAARNLTQPPALSSPADQGGQSLLIGVIAGVGILLAGSIGALAIALGRRKSGGAY